MGDSVTRPPERIKLTTVPQALQGFTDSYCDLWRSQRASQPASTDLCGIPSPCIVESNDEQVFWLPEPFRPAQDLSAVERAMDITLRPEAHQFYATQFAGDMEARHGELAMTLLQTWSADDFERVQQNLIGHLVTQRRLRLSPTVFIATLESDLEVVSLCNLTGEVVLEKLGAPSRTTLAPNLQEFLSSLIPVVR